MLGRLLTDSADEDKTSSLDEVDEAGVSAMVGGKLTFSDTDSTGKSPVVSSTSEKIKSWSSAANSVVEASPKRAMQRVTFEIVSAKTVADVKKKYVSYTILIKRAPGLEKQPGVLERRYTDFANLYQTLKKGHPSSLSDFPFPRKALMGNFTADVITERSVAFQHLLAYAYSIKELRLSDELAEFLYNRELQEAYALMKSGQFEDAAIILENVYFIQEKVLEENCFTIYYTLCILISCLNAVDNVTEAQKYAEIALPISENFQQNELTRPFLVLCVRLWWMVGKDKKALEKKLRERYKDKTMGYTLLEKILARDEPVFYN